MTIECRKVDCGFMPESHMPTKQEILSFEIYSMYIKELRYHVNK